ncbi:hypothetical protein RFN58_04085 [Streptomyces iakyrus]|uniref:hypothetical protein n=1 Tax=Streptomyces iakyrus TaxID=68219 RepID=UPI001FD7534E|nr:hypothetical protein [Streptomyces iakyrus]
MDDLVDQGFGIDHGVGQAGQGCGVVGPRAARGPTPVEQRRGVVDDGQETTPGVVEEQLRRGAEGGGAQRGGVAIATGGVHGLPGVVLGADVCKQGCDGRRLAGVNGLLVGGEVPVGEGLGSPSGERRQDDAARRVGVAVAPFESLGREGPH